MTMIEGSLTGTPGGQRAILQRLQALLRSIGSANDAEDHGYLEDAGRMREDSCEAIRSLLAEHAFLGKLLPTLNWELDSGHILGFGWTDVCDQVEKLAAGLGKNDLHKQCDICSSLADQEYAFQKYGAEQYDTHLPEAANALKVVRDFKPHDSRKLQIWQCPGCGTCYLYRTDYEYLVNGSEDEEFLTRLTEAQAREEMMKYEE
jgi:hypothetical protein